MSSRPATMTQQKMLCELYQAQLLACSMNILRIVRLLVLGEDADKKTNDAEKMTVAQIQQCLQHAKKTDGVFLAFCEMININEQCKHLPSIITNLATAFIECLQLRGVALPPNPLKLLFGFVLRTCFEKPVLLHATDTKEGPNLDIFRERIALFYAECLLF